MSIEKYFCAVAILYTGQLDKSTWQIVFIYRGDEDTASSQSLSEAQQEARGVSKVFSRGGNNVRRNKDRPSLYFCWQVFQRDADRISIANVGTAPLAIQFVFDAWAP